MSLKLISAPSVEPVTLAEAKLHLRVDVSEDDALITALITAARQYAEHLTGRAFIEQTWELVIDAFPSAEIRLAYPPLSSIVHVKFLDEAGIEQTMDIADYAADTFSQPGYLLPAYGEEWPSTLESANAVLIRYVAGYGPDASYVPDGIKAWIKVRVTSLYEQRSELADSRLVTPSFVDRLLDPFVVYG